MTIRINCNLFSVCALPFIFCTQASAEIIHGIEFPDGKRSFADRAVLYNPLFSGGPGPTDPNFMDKDSALKAPDYDRRTQQGAVSLGDGGLLILAFTDNMLMNSGDERKDLYIFEIGSDIEDTFVWIHPTKDTAPKLAGIQRDGDGFIGIDKVYGSTSDIDIDSFFPGFPPFALKFDMVKLMDDPDKDRDTGDTVGADIDAVGAITSEKIEIVRVVELAAEGNIPIQGFSNPVWRSEFDSDGVLVESSPPESDPLAAGMKIGSFFLYTVLGRWTKIPEDPPLWLPQVQCKYFISTMVDKKIRLKGKSDFVGWSGMVEVKVPQRVNSYILDLEFKIFGPSSPDPLSSQKISLKLYVTLDRLPPIFHAIPKEVWLQKATAWASGSRNEKQAAEKLVSSIYDLSGWRYVPNMYGDPFVKLIEAKDGSTVGNDCVGYSDAWGFLCMTIGIYDFSLEYTRGRNGNGFMTHRNAQVLDRSRSGNALNAPPPPPVLMSYNWDRWVFRGHRLGKRGNTYYDPTFNKTYQSLEKYWKNNEFELRYDHDLIYNYADNNKKSYMLIMFSVKEFWKNNIFNLRCFLYYDHLGPNSRSKEESASESGFTDIFSSSGEDRDGDGRFDSLAIHAEVDVREAGDFFVTGSLGSAGSSITSRSTCDATEIAEFQLTSGPGLVPVSLDFSGEDIRTSGIDGPYAVQLFLLDGEGRIVSDRTFETLPFTARQFGELPGAIVGATDSTADGDGNGFAESLDVDLALEVFKPMEFHLQGTLWPNDGDGDPISFAALSPRLEGGTSAARLRFDGRAIWRRGIAGPYFLQIVLHDEDGKQVSAKDFATKAYEPQQFERRPILLSGPFGDRGRDADGDGLYDSLAIEAVVSASEAGRYSIIGWLESGDGESTASAETTLALFAGDQAISLEFSGPEVLALGSEGPYRLSYLQAMDESGSLVDSISDAHTTGTYPSASFDPPGPPSLLLTGNFEDRPVDADGNGLFDALSVLVELTASEPGHLRIEGTLVSGSGALLGDAVSEFVPAVPGEPQRIALDFNGRLISALSENGPYRITSFRAIHTADPIALAPKGDVHLTAPYEYSRFEPAAKISGTVKTSDGKPIALAKILAGGKNAFSGEDGSYSIIFLDEGTFTVAADPPPGDPGAIGMVSVDGVPQEGSRAATIEVRFGSERSVDFRLSRQDGDFFVRGDSSADGSIDISDPIVLLGFLYLGSPETLPCEKSADVDDSGELDISDAVLILGHLFLDQKPPSEPFPACGADPTEDFLTCDSFPPCS